MEIGEAREVGPAESHRHILRCLLHYHERMMMGMAPCKSEEKCPRVIFSDVYADALKEAIRCIELVHQDELVGVE